MSPMLGVHILGGAVAIVAGFTALFVGKGSSLHRSSGQVFVAGMVVLGLSAAPLGNIAGGLMAVYFVVTAFTTVRPLSRQLDIGLMFFALALGLLNVADGTITLLDGKMARDGVPVPMILFLGTVMLLSSWGDYKLIRRGPLRGSPRIIRHLWRMCFSLWIAAGSFFTIRKRVETILPEPFLDLWVRMIPVILPLLAIFYWLWRIKYRKTFKPVRIREARDEQVA
jgi:uncharacterized membrane protein